MAADSKEQQLIADLNKYPDSTLLLENLSQYYRENNDYEKAINIVNEKLRQDSSIPVYWHIKGVLHYENDDTLQAIQALEKSSRLTNDVSDMLLLAKLYAETKNNNALVIADAILKQNVFTKEALFIKGTYYEAVENEAEAMKYFDAAISNSYTFAEAYAEKAKILYRHAEYMEALRVLNTAVQVRKNFSEGYYLMGRCFEKLSRIEDAKESYQTALIYDPGYTDASQALKSLP